MGEKPTNEDVRRSRIEHGKAWVSRIEWEAGCETCRTKDECCPCCCPYGQFIVAIEKYFCFHANERRFQ